MSIQLTNSKLSLKHFFIAFGSLPRIFRLVWVASPWLTSALVFISLLQGFLPTVNMAITAFVIDSVVKAIKIHSISPIFLPIILQSVVMLLTNLVGLISSISQQVLQIQVSNRIQILILEKADSLDLSFFENSRFYDKLRMATDQSTTQPITMISQVFDMSRNILTLALTIALLFHLTWWLAIVALIIPIPTFLIGIRYGWRGYLLMHNQSSERRIMNYITTLLTTDTYKKEIKLFMLGPFFIHKFQKTTKNLLRETQKNVTGRSLSNFVGMSITSIANVSIYLYIAIQAVLGRITLGGLTFYTQTALQAGQSFQNLLSNISSAYEMYLYVNSLFDFLTYTPKIVSPMTPKSIENNIKSSGFDIEFRNVSFTYPGKNTMSLKHISFAIHSGETFALVGQNGAGKTTLIKLLTRLYDPDEGVILINGRNIKEYNLTELRNQIGVIFQDYITYQMSAHENIGVGRITDIKNRTLVTSAAQKSGASSIVERLPNGYNTMLGRWFNDGVQLSGGEWQKFALARAFMRDSSILILDEPTSALDAQAEHDIFTNFRVLTKGKTAIFISHRFSTVRLADYILVLENGEIIEQGSHDHLIACSGHYAKLFLLQAEAYR